MKPFDLQAAKTGAELVTEEGKPARILCYDFLRYNFEQGKIVKTILAAIKEKENGEDYEVFGFYDSKGKMILTAKQIFKEKPFTKYDLYIKEKKREGYIAIYKNKNSLKEEDRRTEGIIYDNLKTAETLCDKNENFIAISKIKWEE